MSSSGSGTGCDLAGPTLRVPDLRTLVAEILAAWRRAERLAGSLPAGTSEQAAAEGAAERLRDLYHELTSSGIQEVTEADARALIAELDATNS
jgi:hypothetical protein